MTHDFLTLTADVLDTYVGRAEMVRSERPLALSPEVNDEDDDNSEVYLFFHTCHKNEHAVDKHVFSHENFK